MDTSIQYQNVSSKKVLIKADAILLGLYFFLTPFDQMLNFGNGTVLKFIGIIFIVVSLFKILILRTSIKFFDPIIYGPILLIIISYSSILWSINIEATLRMNYSYLVLQIMFLAVYIRNYNYKEQNYIKQAILYGGVAISFYVIVLNPDLLYSGDRLVLNKESDPNHFAATLILPLLVSFGEMMQSKKIWLIFLFGSLLILLLFTGSRGGMLSAVIAISYFFFKNRKLKNIYILIIIIGLLIGIIDFVLTDFIIERLWTERGVFNDNSSVNSRSFIWALIFLEIIPQMPLLGFGSGSPQFALGAYFGQDYATHNAYLTMILEYGILGISIFILFLSSIFRRLKQELDYTKITLFIAFIIIILFLDSFHTKWFWNTLMFCVISYKSFPKIRRIKNNVI